jgi:5-methylcytosine-specific restriction endonuclease McrA
MSPNAPFNSATATAFCGIVAGMNDADAIAARREKKRAYDKARYAGNEALRDKKKAVAKAHYDANRDAKKKASNDRYHAKAPEILQQQAERRFVLIASDPTYIEKERAADQARRAANPELYREISKRARKAKIEREPDYNARILKERYWKDPEKARARGVVDANKRRARKLAAGGEIPGDAVAVLFERQKGKCVFCLEPFGAATPHMDHYIALSKGGTNDMSNLRLLHRECNLKKHSKHPIDFALQHGLLCW